MTQTIEGISSIASEYLADRLSLETLDAAVANLAESPYIHDPALRSLWADLELLFAELSNGDLDEAQFRSTLAGIVPMTLVLGGDDDFTVRQMTSTSARLVSSPFEGLFRASLSPGGDRSGEEVPA